MEENFDSRFTVICTIKLKYNFNSRCQSGHDAIDAFKTLNEELLAGFKSEDITFEVVDNMKTQSKESKQKSSNMTNKEKCILFCRTLESHDIYYLEGALYNEQILSEDIIEYKKMLGCPNNFGLENAKHFCEYPEDESICADCWCEALK